MDWHFRTHYKIDWHFRMQNCFTVFLKVEVIYSAESQVSLFKPSVSIPQAFYLLLLLHWKLLFRCSSTWKSPEKDNSKWNLSPASKMGLEPKYERKRKSQHIVRYNCKSIAGEVNSKRQNGVMLWCNVWGCVRGRDNFSAQKINQVKRE